MGSSSRPASRSSQTRRRARTGPACSIARTRASLSPRSGSWSTGKVIRSGERVVVLSTANGLKFADQKAAYHMGALDGIKPAHRNKPVELPADAKRVARAIARHVEKARALVP